MKALKLLIYDAAQMYGKDLKAETLDLYLELFSEHPIEVVMGAIKKYMRDPKNKFMFLPAQILEMIDPKSNPEQIANEVASRIIMHVAGIGYADPARAEEKLGPFAWHIVKLMGGWSHLCQTMMAGQENTWRAQIRDLARGQWAKQEAGIPLDAPAEKIGLPQKSILLTLGVQGKRIPEATD